MQSREQHGKALGCRVLKSIDPISTWFRPPLMILHPLTSVRHHASAWCPVAGPLKPPSHLATINEVVKNSTVDKKNLLFAEIQMFPSLSPSVFRWYSHPVNNRFYKHGSCPASITAQSSTRVLMHGWSVLKLFLRGRDGCKCRAMETQSHCMDCWWHNFSPHLQLLISDKPSSARWNYWRYSETSLRF